jgi:hypothetical protein
MTGLTDEKPAGNAGPAESTPWLEVAKKLQEMLREIGKKPMIP